MAKEIKQKIVLEGEKEYNQAIREAQRNLRTLKSELKAETAELGKNATEQQKNETRTKSLQKQIKEQEKIVRTLREALNEAKAQYGDNADVVQKWEQKLNEARATLGNMKNSLDDLGQGFRSVGADAQMGTVAAKSYADSLEKIADAGAAVSGVIEGIFQGMVSVVSDAISTVWEDMVDLAGRANAWVDLAGFWNTDAATIQKWTHAVEGAHNSFEDLNNAVTRINMGDQAKIAEATGVSGENYSDKWQYAMAVMDAMAGMDYDKMLEASGAIFGERRATKVMDLLNDWTTIRENLQKFDVNAGGIGMTEEQIQDMSTLAEQVDTIKATWKAFLDSFEAEHFGKLALNLTGNAQRILEDLIKYLDTGSDEDLEQLEKDVTEFFDRIKTALENAAGKLDEAGKKLEESDKGIVRAIGQAMQGLAGALEWISDENNIDKVIHGFEVLAAFWIAGKGLQLVGTISSLAADFKVIQGFNAASTAAGAASGASSAAAGLGASIASALRKVTLSVGLAAILCYPLLERLIHGETAEEKAAREQQEKINEVGEQMKEAGAEMPTGKEVMQYLFTGKVPESYHERAEAQKEALAAEKEANTPRAYVPTTGVISPARTARFDATEAQQAAANAFWDVWRDYTDGKATDEDFDAAYAAMEAAFEGNEKVFEQVDEWLDKLMEALNSREGETDFNPENWMDLPATWWKNPAGVTNENGITSKDIEGLNSLPAGIQTAVQRGAAQGISGIRVSLDGRTVGELVAPYVSAAIARDIA